MANYESYGPIVAGLKSAEILKSNSITDIETNKLNFSDTDTIMAVSKTINKQDPFNFCSLRQVLIECFDKKVTSPEMRQNFQEQLPLLFQNPCPETLRKNLEVCFQEELPAKPSSKTLLQITWEELNPKLTRHLNQIGKTLKHLEKMFKHSDLLAAPESSIVVSLTPDQQKVLNGPNWQLIMGPASMGKTIVIQVKALQLLKVGEPVLVIAPESVLPRYLELFSSRGYIKSKHYELNYRIAN